MTTRRANIGRGGIPRSAAECVEPGVTDRELLRRFAGRQDEAAFEALVRRHGSLVLAAGRRALGNAHDAEDVCQAAFLLLAQKASSRRWQPSVAGWLHRTAHLLALKMQTAAARRARREGRAAPRIPADPLAELTGREVLAALDAELAALPEPLRDPLVLCYLEGATRDEAAERLGCPLATLKKRLERGRDRLHAALARRGLGLSSVLLGTLFFGPSAEAGLAALARKTAHTARGLASGNLPDGIIAPRVRQLIEGGVAMTGWNKVRAVLAILLAGGIVSAAGAVAYSARDDNPAPPPQEKAAASEKKAERPADPAAARALRVVVLDPEGKPVPGANVHVGVWTQEKSFKANRDLQTDAEGAARVELPKTFYILRLWARKKPFVPLFADWEQAELTSGQGVPAEYTFRMERAVRAGGRVVDEQGKPVSGARVEVTLDRESKLARGDGRVGYDYFLSEGSGAATTGADGRWSIDNVPDQPGLEMNLLASHPDFVTDERRIQTKTSGVTTAMLRAGTATLPLKRGVIVRGRVTDPDGRPVKDAVVIHGDDPYGSHMPCKFPTDADGRYRLPALAPGTSSLTVLAPGWAPQLRKVDLRPGLPPQDFRLGPGKPARLRVVGATGRPVPRASVFLMEWKGSKSIYSDHNPNHPKVPDAGIPRRADAGGVWEWRSAPDEPVKLRVYANGFAPLELEVAGGTTERTVTLKAEHRITGAVTDVVTGKPVPAFTVIPVDVFRKDFLAAERMNAASGKGGRLDFLATRTDIPQRLRIEAPGYRAADGPESRIGDDAGRAQDFRLRPSPPRTGRVVDAGGRPVVKAEVLIATPTEQLQVDREPDHRVFTDAAGRFEFPDPGEPWAVVARADSGAASAEFPADRADAGTLRLRPWGSVRGRFHDGGRPVRGATVLLRPARVAGLDRPRVEATLHAVTGPDGRFEFPRVMPGPVSVRVHLGPWKDEGFRSGPSVPLDLEPGGQADLDLGSGGSAVSGKVQLTGKVPAGLDCTYSLNYLVRRQPGVRPPADVAAAGFDARKGWRDAWGDTVEGLAYLGTLHYWFVKLAPDGTFRISGVPPGEYDLSVRVYAKPSGCLVDPLARRVVRVTVTESDAARGELAVPEVAAEVVPVPEVGDTPALSFTRADGTAGTLADCRGKYTVVHFWASWCGPCKKELPALRQLHGRFAARGLAALGLALDDDPAAWRSALKGLDLPWPQGRLGAGGAAGVSGVPAYWLLDPAGKIVAKANDADELAAALEGRLK
jgi:RNA polymerase sigma factor (sigma-70 family)